MECVTKMRAIERTALTQKLNLDVDSIIRLNVKLVVSWPTECDNKNTT